MISPIERVQWYFLARANKVHFELFINSQINRTMLSEIQVKIVFLSLLGREPNPAELQEEIDEVNNTIQALTLKIQSNEEFLELTNTAFGALSFSNDVISLSNIISPFDNGLYMGNNNVSYITSSDYKTVNSPKSNANSLFVPSKPTVTDGKSLRKRTFLPILTAKLRLLNLIRFTRPTMKLLITLN